MGCQSTVKLGNNLTFSVTTHNPTTGVLTDADAVPPYRVYEDENATPILNDDMAKLDDGNTTGFYTELIACTTGNGFEVGKTYTIYIEATVDGDKGGICYAFTVEAATPDVNVTEIEGGDPTDAIEAAAVAALASYDPPTEAEMDAAFAALNDPSAAAVADAVWDEPQVYHTLSGSFGEYIDQEMSLIATPPGTIAAAVWDKLFDDHALPGTFGRMVRQ